MATQRITLAHATDWEGFRRAARALVQAGVAPDAVEWLTAAEAAGDLFADEPQATDLAALPAPSGVRSTPRVPAEFVRLCETLVLHRDPARFALMYRLLWRLGREPGLRQDPLDADRLRAQHMARAVGRDMHKMRAFVRFRPVTDAQGRTTHLAWFEPDHHITEANAPFFVRRFTQMRWAILTPEASVYWDGQQLSTGPGGQRSDAPAPDAGEALWLTYYRNTFNPARLKLNMMRKEMPRRYWHNLPEASLISELAGQAHARSGQMLTAEPTTPKKRIRPMQVARSDPPA